MHGTTQDESRVGFELSGTNNVAVVDSYFSDFHCTAVTGSAVRRRMPCMRAPEILRTAFIRSQDNFLEASGQAILFGGAAATTTPSDITIRLNHFFKPWLWMKGNSPFQGGVAGDPFIVRHHLEFKNAIRVLIEDNLLENVWGGFGEKGDAILLTPKSQHIKSGDRSVRSARSRT